MSVAENNTAVITEENKTTLDDEQYAELRSALSGPSPEQLEEIEAEKKAEDAAKATPTEGTVIPEVLEPEAVQVEKAGEPDWFSGAVKDFADAVGFTEDEAREFGSAKALAAAVRLLGRQPTKIAKSDAPPEVVPEPEDEEFDSLNADDYDDPKLLGFSEKAVKRIKALEKHRKEQDAKLAEFDQVRQFLRHQEEQAHTAWIDQQFGALGDEFVPLFGKGKFEDIRSDAKILQSRNEAFKLFVELRKEAPTANAEKLFRKACIATGGDELLKQARPAASTPPKRAPQKPTAIRGDIQPPSADEGLPEAVRKLVATWG